MRVLYESKIGSLVLETGIRADGAAALRRLDFVKDGGADCLPWVDDVAGDEVLAQCARELDEYFGGTRRVFDVPLMPEGTLFRMKVWARLGEIPYGRAISYIELARRVGNPRASRAVGGANHHNPISIIIPCHRVIAANGQLCGYGGEVWRKEWLLKHEGADVPYS